MRSVSIELIPTHITTYTCDVCGFSTKENKGCCGSTPIMVCTFCKQDTCRTCRLEFYEDTWSDYMDALACSNCKELASKAWDMALETAKRNDYIVDITLKIFNEMKAKTRHIV